MSQARPGRETRSTSRFAGVTRVGLRVVVVAGFAGVAWAMSASAANAATDAPHHAAAGPAASPLTSVVSLVGDLGTRSLHGLLGTAPPAGTPAPTGSVPIHTGTDSTHLPGAGAAGPGVRTSDVVSGSLTSQVAADTPDRPVAAGVNGDAGPGSTDLVRTVAGLVAPLGPDRTVPAAPDESPSMTGVLDPLTAPLDQLLSPVTGVVETVTTPIFDTLSGITRPVVGVVSRSTTSVLTGLATVLAPAPPATGSPIPSVTGAPAAEPTAHATPVRVDGGTPVLRAIVRHGPRGAPARQTPPGVPAHPDGALGAARSDSPAGPAPLPALPVPALGTVSTTASGSHEDHGDTAVVSTTIVDGPAAPRQRAGTTGFTVPRHVVEDPTVSPD
jgi:hypothetical protein